VTVALGVSSVIMMVSGVGTGIWQASESTPLADIAVNRHRSSISSLESSSTSKYPQLAAASAPRFEIAAVGSHQRPLFPQVGPGTPGPIKCKGHLKAPAGPSRSTGISSHWQVVVNAVLVL
jgi:hypothetical protein